MDREKVIKGLYDIGGFIAGRMGFDQARNFLRTIDNAIALLKENDELLHKKQKDIDRLCNEISEWKHNYHDRPLKKQEAVAPFHRCIGNEHALIENSHFDFCPYCGRPIDWKGQENSNDSD